MKKIFSIAASVALLFGVSTVAFAQETVEDTQYPHNFITLKGGAQATLTHYNFTDLITPQVGISFGRYFNSKVGARLDISGWQTKGGFKADRFPGLSADTPYKFNACVADLDLLMNMSNIINPHRTSDKLNWILIAGFGVNYSWKHDEYHAITDNADWYYQPLQCMDKHATFNGRLGTQVEWNVCKNLGLYIEADANYKNDMYNLKLNDKCDWQIAAFIGVNIKFGTPKKKTVAQEPAPEPTPAPAPKPVAKPQPKPQPAAQQVVKKDEPLKETFFYAIRESEVGNETIINKIVNWCNEYPSKGITVSGYADKGTGTAKVNKKYAEQRAVKVADALKAKGVSPDRITVNSYGDTVQPFEDNDSNRCVIVVGE